MTASFRSLAACGVLLGAALALPSHAAYVADQATVVGKAKGAIGALPGLADQGSFADRSETQAAPAPGSVQPMVAAVPEPETYALMAAGLGLLGVVARRRRRA